MFNSFFVQYIHMTNYKMEAFNIRRLLLKPEYIWKRDCWDKSRVVKAEEEQQ